VDGEEDGGYAAGDDEEDDDDDVRRDQRTEIVEQEGMGKGHQTNCSLADNFAK